MNHKYFKILSFVTVAFILLAGYSLLNVEFSQKPQFVETPYLKDFNQQLSNIDEIILRQQDKKIILKHKNHGWVLSNIDNYPANKKMILQLFHALESMMIVDKKTDNPQFFEQLSLEKPNKKSQAMQIITKDGSDKIIHNLIIGKRIVLNAASQKQRYFARQDANTQSYIIETSVLPNVHKSTWLANDFDLPKENEIQSILITANNTKPILFERKKPDQIFVTNNIPRGYELASPSISYNFSNFMTYFKPMNVIKRNKDKILNDDLVLNFTDFKFNETQIYLFAENEKYYSFIDNTHNAEWVYEISPETYKMLLTSATQMFQKKRHQKEAISQ